MTTESSLHEIYSLPAVIEYYPIQHNICGLNIPDEPLYHYTSSVTAVKNILTTGELWLSKSTVMNDYSEIGYGISLIKGKMEERIEDNPFFEFLMKKFAEYLEDEAANYYILSFSKNQNSRLLWDSYANKNGYCVEFSPDLIYDFATGQRLRIIKPGVEGFEYGNCAVMVKQAESDKKPLNGYSRVVLANDVIYDEIEQAKLIDEVLDYISSKNSSENWADIVIAMNLLIDMIPFLKDPSLRDEEEYRLVVKIEATKKEANNKKEYLRNVQYYRESNNKLFPYIKLQMNTKHYIKSVTLGYLNRDELSKQTFKEFISTLPENIDVYEVNYALRW